MRHLLRSGDRRCVSRSTINSTISFRPAILSPIRSEAHPRSVPRRFYLGTSSLSLCLAAPPPRRRRFMRHNDQLFRRPGNSELSLSPPRRLERALKVPRTRDPTSRPTVDVESSRAATSTQLYRRGARICLLSRPRVLFPKG